jgi:signal peptidase I
MRNSRKFRQAKNPAPTTICRRQQERLFHKKNRRALLMKIGTVAIIAMVILRFVFGVAVVQDQTMYPSMRDGDLVLYYRLDTDYGIGDIVTFVREDIRHYGRITALAGDTVDMSEEGDLLINGNVQAEDILYPTYKTEAVTGFPYTVPEGHCFLLGDMRTGAMDSRDYGGVAFKEIDGKIFTVIKRRGL